MGKETRKLNPPQNRPHFYTPQLDPGDVSISRQLPVPFTWLVFTVSVGPGLLIRFPTFGQLGDRPTGLGFNWPTPHTTIYHTDTSDASSVIHTNVAGCGRVICGDAASGKHID